MEWGPSPTLGCWGHLPSQRARRDPPRSMLSCCGWEGEISTAARLSPDAISSVYHPQLCWLPALRSSFSLFFPCFSCRRQCRRCPAILEKFGGLAQERLCFGGLPGGRMPFKSEERPQLNHAAGPQTLKPVLEKVLRGPGRVQIPLIQAHKQLQRHLEKCWGPQCQK